MKQRGNGKLGATLRGVVLGILISVLVFSIAVPSMAETVKKTIEVAVGDIKIYIDGNLQHPTDVNGNTVQPFIYQGTTYLPVRALTNMLTDKTIGWDGETKSVFIGTQPKKTNTPLEDLEPLEKSSVWKVETGRYARYSINGKEYSPNNAVTDGNKGPYGSEREYNMAYAIYKLEKQYSGILGNLIVADRSSDGTILDGVKNEEEYVVSFYEVDLTGKERLIADFSSKAGEDLSEVFVDLSGIDLLKIQIGCSNTKTSLRHWTQPVFYNVNLIPEWIME